MALLHSTESAYDWVAPPFSLPSTQGGAETLETLSGPKGLLVVFMCNHCPYVVAIHERLSRLARDFKSRGIHTVGINSNDPQYRSEDSFENMIRISKEWDLPFPYLFDESQSVAKAYDAVCTPDPYLFEKVGSELRLRYRGRIDDSWKDEARVGEQSLKRAMERLLDGTSSPGGWVPSMGCSIKWRELTPPKAGA